MFSVSDIIRAISNDKSLVLFNTIALAGEDRSIMISRLNLTRKQYYSKISELTNAGLIQRNNGRFFLTSLGKVVYEAHILIGQALQLLPKLKAIDSIEFSEFPNSELTKVIDSLITDVSLKQILISSQGYNNIENKRPYNTEHIAQLV